MDKLQRPKSLSRFGPRKSKKEQFLDEMRYEVDYLIQKHLEKCENR